MAGKEYQDLPYDLENMSIPELEALLQQDFIASDGSAPDVDYVMAIVEVIQRKEQEKPGYQPLDTKQAWEEFQAFCRDRASHDEGFSHFREEENSDSKSAAQISKTKKQKFFRRNLLIAAVICLLVAVTCVPVLGHKNVIQMVASWTADQFHFYLPDSQPQSRSVNEIPEEYLELKAAMEENGDQLIIPNFPEDFEIGEPVLQYSEEEKTLTFSIMYHKESEYIIFSVIHKNEPIDGRSYEKRNPDAECHIYNEIEYYTFPNNKNTSVAWYTTKTEYNIVTNVSSATLEDILKTTYEV